MRLLDALIGSQIRRPSGWLGRLLGHLMAHEHRPLTAWAFEPLRLSGARRTLDLGSGGGMAMRMAADQAPDALVVGIDYARAMAAQSAARNRERIRQGRAAVIHGSVAALPFATGAFDAAYAIETFYFWPDPAADLREVRRTLRAGGRLALAMDISREGPDPTAIVDNASRLGFAVYGRDDLAELLRQAGFSDVSVTAEPGRGKGWLRAVGTNPAP